MSSKNRIVVERQRGEHGLHIWTDWVEMSDGRTRCFVAATHDTEPLYVGSSYECDVWLAGYAYGIAQQKKSLAAMEGVLHG